MTSLMNPLGLNYFSGHPNFGDSLSPILVGWLSGRTIKKQSVCSCDLTAVGSVLFDGSALFAEGEKASSGKLHIWGSGFLSPKLDALKGCPCRELVIHAVRGRETEHVLKDCGLLSSEEKPAVGDPGLLYPYLIPGISATPKTSDIALVPHTLDRDPGMEVVRKLQNAGMSVLPVDVGERNPLDCVRQIASCRMVLASSLHALIVADALGIPNARLRFSDGNDQRREYEQSDFKFRDYYSAFQMDPPESYAVMDLLDNPSAVVGEVRRAPGVERSKIDECVNGLLDAFPFPSARRMLEVWAQRCAMQEARDAARAKAEELRRKSAEVWAQRCEMREARDAARAKAEELRRKSAEVWAQRCAMREARDAARVRAVQLEKELDDEVRKSNALEEELKAIRGTRAYKIWKALQRFKF